MPLLSRSLPVDILYMVFELVADKQTLYSLLVVSRAINYIIAPLLYKNLSFKASHCFHSLSQGCLRQLEANDCRLASHVQNAVICLPLSGDVYTTTTYSYLEALLRLLTNIKRLDVSFADSYAQKIHLANLRSPLRTSKLTHLFLGVSKDVEELAMLLESQPLLQHFRIEGIIEAEDEDEHGDVLEDMITDIPLSSDALPNLDTLEAPIEVALHVMRDRESVTHVHFRVQQSDILLDIFEGHEYPNVRTLSATRVYSKSLVQWATYFPNVEYLNLGIWDTIRPHRLDSASFVLNQSKVRYVRLSSTSCQDGVHRAVPAMFDAIPSLRILDIMAVGPLDKSRRFHRDGEVQEKVVITPGSHWDPWWQSIEKDLHALDSEDTGLT